MEREKQGEVINGRVREGFSDTARIGLLVLLFLVLVSAAGIALVLGAYDVSAGDAFRVLFAHLNPFSDDAGKTRRLHETIIWDLRVPRILLAVLVGAVLSTAGAIFQGCFRNPLVEPYILGVSSGAAFGAALGILMDEPTSALDFSNQIRIWRIIRRVVGQGITVLACSHDPNHVSWFCDRVIVMDSQGILAEGPPGDVITEPVLNRVYPGTCTVRDMDSIPVVMPKGLVREE